MMLTRLSTATAFAVEAVTGAARALTWSAHITNIGLDDHGQGSAGPHAEPMPVDSSVLISTGNFVFASREIERAGG